MKKIAIFASGSGSNAENIYQYFQKDDAVEVTLIVCNNKNAFVIERFMDTDVKIVLLKNKELTSDSFIQLLKDKEIDLIVLAGFLALIPVELIQNYPKKIINIHPALLPKYGGKGMYGDNVHKAVLENKESEHGITIHYVNEAYDEGEIILQEKFSLSDKENLESLKKKIHALEFEYFPMVIKTNLSSSE